MPYINYFWSEEYFKNFHFLRRISHDFGICKSKSKLLDRFNDDLVVYIVLHVTYKDNKNISPINLESKFVKKESCYNIKLIEIFVKLQI